MFNWHYRSNTTDQQIIDHVYTNNEYGMPDDMTGMHVIDVGAHIGAFSVLCAERGAFVDAYEPYPDNFALLQQNIKNFRTRVIEYCVALGAGTYTDLHINPPNMGGHSTVLQVSNLTMQVSLLPLHYMIISLPFTCDVLKLDCEGAEIYAIPALVTDNLHERVRSIVMEFHTDEQQALRDMLDPYYTAEHIFQGEWRFTHR